MKSVSIQEFFDKTPNAGPSDIMAWMESASIEHLLDSISMFGCNIKLNEHAKALLQIRIAQQAADSASKIIQHSEKLTEQTDKLLNESVSLTTLTKQLKFWTIALGFFAVVQIVIMLFDYLKHK